MDIQEYEVPYMYKLPNFLNALQQQGLLSMKIEKQTKTKKKKLHLIIIRVIWFMITKTFGHWWIWRIETRALCVSKNLFVCVYVCLEIFLCVFVYLKTFLHVHVCAKSKA
jgi:hypothetical protein